MSADMLTYGVGEDAHFFERAVAVSAPRALVGDLGLTRRLLELTYRSSFLKERLRSGCPFRRSTTIDLDLHETAFLENGRVAWIARAPARTSGWHVHDIYDYGQLIVAGLEAGNGGIGHWACWYGYRLEPALRTELSELRGAHALGLDRVRIRRNGDHLEAEITPVDGKSTVLAVNRTCLRRLAEVGIGALEGALLAALARWDGGVGPWCGEFVADDEVREGDDWNYGFAPYPDPDNPRAVAGAFELGEARRRVRVIRPPNEPYDPNDRLSQQWHWWSTPESGAVFALELTEYGECPKVVNTSNAYGDSVAYFGVGLNHVLSRAVSKYCDGDFGWAAQYLGDETFEVRQE